MTKVDAYRAMHAGKVVTHEYFTPQEYIHIKKGIITTEEGYDFTAGFINRTGIQWNTGWSIFRGEVKNEGVE